MQTPYRQLRSLGSPDSKGSRRGSRAVVDLARDARLAHAERLDIRRAVLLLVEAAGAVVALLRVGVDAREVLVLEQRRVPGDRAARDEGCGELSDERRVSKRASRTTMAASTVNLRQVSTRRTRRETHWTPPTSDQVSASYRGRARTEDGLLDRTAGVGDRVDVNAKPRVEDGVEHLRASEHGGGGERTM